MTIRNLSPQTMFEELAYAHKPSCRFDPKKQNFAAWKKNTFPKVMATLGDFPPKVKLNPQLLAEWEEDGLRKQRWIIDVGRHISAVFQINIPGDLKPGARCAAILCCHGHGSHGKMPVMGDESSPAKREEVSRCNYNYGHQMAKAGFVTYAIDWIGFGERSDDNKPNRHGRAPRAGDWCDTYYLHATMLGMTSISINVIHGMAATDFACTFPFVDKTKLGVMGLSGGGTMSTWMALCDKRVKAAEIICYSDLWAYFGIRDINYCGMQVAPGLFKLVDLPDLQGLIAPKPLLVDIGIYDICFLVDGAMMCFRQVEKIYKAAGVSRNLELDLFPGAHTWGGNKSVDFFRRHLNG